MDQANLGRHLESGQLSLACFDHQPGQFTRVNGYSRIGDHERHGHFTSQFIFSTNHCDLRYLRHLKDDSLNLRGSNIFSSYFQHVLAPCFVEDKTVAPRLDKVPGVEPPVLLKA